MKSIINSLMENPKEAEEALKYIVKEYKPLLYVVCNEILGIYKDFSENLEYPATVAKSRMNLYKAYVDVGFSNDQAMALLLQDIKNIKTLKDNIKQSSENISKK